jgi:predicted metal-binding membrane protein
LKQLDQLPLLMSRHRIVPCDAPLETEHGIMTHATFPANDPERALPRTIGAGMVSRRASEQAFPGISALLFGASAAATIAWYSSLSVMAEMPMCGGRMMSMAWMRMPGQTWPGAAASFLVMWVVMMVAMMLPSLVPMLWRYRQAVCKTEAADRTGETRLAWLTALVGAGYFLVWTVFGMAAFPLGAALTAVAMQQPVLARAVPIAVGVVVLIAGALQFTPARPGSTACASASTAATAVPI